MGKREYIIVPLPAVGHIVSTMEFANRLLHQDDTITITVLVWNLPIVSPSDSFCKSLVHSQPRIQLIQLPEIVYPPQELFAKAVEYYIEVVAESYKPHVRTAVSKIISSRSKSQEQSTRVSALILDFFCASMIDIGNEFNIPSYVYFTSATSFLSFMLSLPSRHKEVGREFQNSDPELSLPSFTNPVPVQVLPSGVFNPHGAYATYVNVASRFREAKGIVINTFPELESRAINSLSDGDTPPIYPIGPVVSLKAQPHPELDNSQWGKCMNWLDKQPQTSVLFLCFGSGGGFNNFQVEEIALGLERSECRFLWCLRARKGLQNKKPEEMLPKGFLERVGERGIVCGWGNQVEVLGHKAIGGFISHCGWNSILESLWYGVPIATLPIQAEQQFNAFLMAKELGLAEDLRIDYRPDDFVTSEEIEKAVKSVMQSDSTVRKKVKEIGAMARKAVMEGGSSSASIAKLINDITSNSC